MNLKTAVQIAPDNLKLAVVMVGLPARGKSYTARRVERYLSWLGYRTRVFNVGEYRRARVGAQLPHSFFDPDNPSGEQARRSVAMAALEDMVGWLTHDGQVAIYDATNTTRERRATVRARCERSGFQVLFIEIRCDDPSVIEANIRATKLSSPDYEDADPEDAATDFRARIAHYERVYRPLEDDEGAYLRVTGAGRGVTVSNVDGYLAARLVFFLMNLHLTARPIWLTRHGESVFNAAGLLGGDPDLTPDGRRYARSLAEFLDRRYPDRDDVVIWTSSLRRSIQTADPLGRPPWAWRALDEIDAGICDGMSYVQIQAELPEEYAARKRDKFTYRYPRGESYQDIILRLDPVIIELERTRKPVLVIAHNAVLRALYAYFQGVARERCPYLDIPLHTVIELTPHAYGCHEARLGLEPILESSEAL
ncbi:MAG TPA: 6-phosphofructo-2-kinase/fructose-2,6-bisphosphatase [Methylomirabilota bacterium]|jgi:broad specificity phosphatase PhoE/predicted kinase